MATNFSTISTLFRSEFSKIVAVITKVFGLEHLQLAEDIVSETFLQAMETWEAKGVPENPLAWLYTVAKNKMHKYIERDRMYKTKVLTNLKRQGLNEAETDQIFTVENIKNSQLQMIFAICDPLIASEAQIGLALRILAGLH